MYAYIHTIVTNIQTFMHIIYRHTCRQALHTHVHKGQALPMAERHMRVSWLENTNTRITIV